MEEIQLPFPKTNFGPAFIDIGKLTLDRLSPSLQDIAAAKPWVWEYLQGLPIKEIGMPAYYPKLSRKLKALRVRNLIYPTNNADVFIHIYPDLLGDRDIYIPIEPTTTIELSELTEQVEHKLLDVAEEIGQAGEAERGEAFRDALDQITTVATFGKKKNSGKILVTARELVALKYVMVRDKLGLGAAPAVAGRPLYRGHQLQWDREHIYRA